MSKKLAKIISQTTDTSVWEALMFIRGETLVHEARMSGPRHQRKEARQCLFEAREAWARGVPLALPSVGSVDRYYVPSRFFVRSGVPLTRMSKSEIADDMRRQRERRGVTEPREVVEE